jgi:hypothetical protein
VNVARKSVPEVGQWPIDRIRVGGLSIREAEALIDASRRAIDAGIIDKRKTESTERAIARLSAEVEPLKPLLKDYRRYRKMLES